ncbi:MAG: 23S rRNA (cytidine(2498)-2'-O)-methyltransferase RlmM [Chitinophagaceae bacterium]|nr:23S rRNA (cytidine(2498)-2'-O)-methyltransferase RlmM [Oligoflexus sp.]
MRFILYCRPGFEKDCVAEAHDQFASLGWDGYPEIHGDNGVVSYHGTPYDPENPRAAEIPKVANFVFTRHILEQACYIKDLPEGDRATKLAEALLKTTKFRNFRELVLEFPDTNEGRALANFCKKFHPAMGNALKRNGFTLDRGNHDAPAIHICFLDYGNAVMGLSWKKRSSPWRSGIPRLKFPEDAPSRSTLKLDEAFVTLLTEEERTARLQGGGTAVDLGASPGGWTYQLLERSFFVTAVDNGKMAESLMATGMVDHKSEDAFKFKPKAAVDLLVCDMVEKPQRVIELVARWFKEQTCSWAVINLKLPMKKRFAELEACQLAFWEQSGLTEDKFEIRAKQLYHDREEVTLVLIPKPKKARR